MSIYDDLKTVSDSVLGDFDQKGIVLISKDIDAESSPDEPQMKETEYSLRGVVKGVSFKYLKDGFITSSDLEVTTNVLDSVKPSINDNLKINEEIYNIIEFKPVPACGTACVWKFIVRKGG